MNSGPTTKTVEIPCYPQAVIGFRAWHWNAEALTLRALWWSHLEWTRGLNHFSCLQRHSFPDSKHNCGLHAYHALGHDIREQIRTARQHSLVERYFGGGSPDTILIGAVLAKGYLQIHEDGFRAEKMSVIAFKKPGLLDKQPASTAAEHFQVPLLGTRQLRGYAQSLGQPVPRELIPRW